MKKKIFNLFLSFLSMTIPSCENVPVSADSSSGKTESTGVPFFLSAFQIDKAGYESECGAGWVQITVSDETKLQSNWKLCSASSNSNKTVLIDSSSYNSLPWVLHTGDRIRLHPVGNYTGPDDRTVSSCGEDNEYDYLFENSPPSDKSGVIWVEDGKGIVCDIVYYSAKGSNVKCIIPKADGSLSDGQAALQSAIVNGEWSSSDSVFSYDPTAGYAHISYSVINAVSPSDWQCLKGSSIYYSRYVSLDSFTASPAIADKKELVTIRAALSTYHGGIINAVWFDFYSPESSFNPPSQRVTENVNGVYSYIFDTANSPAGTWYVSIYVDSDYAEIQNEISFVVK